MERNRFRPLSSLDLQPCGAIFPVLGSSLWARVVLSQREIARPRRHAGICAASTRCCCGVSHALDFSLELRHAPLFINRVVTEAISRESTNAQSSCLPVTFDNSIRLASSVTFERNQSHKS